MKKWNLIIDVTKCENCANCFLSCKDKHVDNDFSPHSVAQPRHGHNWMNIQSKERGQFPIIDVAYLPIPCMHCDNPPCLKAAKNGAIYKRSDGIVIIDPEKAKGQRQLVESCPYDAIWWNEEKDVAQKCTFCVHLLEKGWKEPRCVQACPTGALRVVKADDSEMEKLIEPEKLEFYHPEYKTSPRVYYKNLYRFTRCFIGGSVAVVVGDTTECAEGAKVALLKDSKRIDEASTDNYGDFKFDNLEENSGLYQIEISSKGYPARTLEVNLITSANVGTLFL